MCFTGLIKTGLKDLHKGLLTHIPSNNEVPLSSVIGPVLFSSALKPYLEALTTFEGSITAVALGSRWSGSADHKSLFCLREKRSHFSHQVAQKVSSYSFEPLNSNRVTAYFT